MNKVVLSLLIKGKDLSRAAFSKATSSITGLKNKVVSLQGALVAMGVTATFMVGKKLVAAFGRQERAILRVSQALANQNQFSQENVKRLEANAAALQKVTQAGDEAILEGTATIAELATQLDALQLEQIQSAMIGIADTFFKGDIPQAALMLGKSIGTSVNALARYGVELDMAGTQQDKFQQVMERAIPWFRTSQAAATDVLGVMAQLGNAYGDLQESLGGVITASLELRTSQGNVRDWIMDLTKAIENNEGNWIKWGRTIVAVIKAVATTFSGIIKMAFNLGEIIGASLEAVFFSTAEFGARMLDLIPGVDMTESIEANAAAALAATKGIEEDVIEFTEALVAIGDAWIDVGRNAMDASAVMRNAFAPENVPAPPPWMAQFAGEGRMAGGTPIQQLTQAVVPTTVATPATLGMVQRLGTQLMLAFKAGENLDELLIRMTDRTLTGFGDAIMDASQAFVDGSQAMGDAFESAMLGAISAVARAFGEYFLAKALGALGEGLTFNPAGFAAAGKYTAAAAAMFSLAGATAGGAGGGGRGGIAGATTAVAGEAQGTVTAILEGDLFLNSADPRSVDRFQRFMEDMSGRRVIIKVRS